VNGVRVDLPYATQSGKIEVRATTVWPDAVVSVEDRGTIEISGFDASGGSKGPDTRLQEGKPRDRVVLSMAGFSAAYTTLRKVCTETTSADKGCSPGELSPRCMPDALKTWHPTSSAAGGEAAWPAQ
jgi:hypothetical protein